MSLIRSTLTVGGLTMASRLLGFVRDVLIARYVGAGMAADAFFVAFKLPNLFRRLFAEGAFSAAFVPLFAAAAARSKAEGRSFAEHVLAALLPILLIFTAAMEALMPWVVLAITGGFYGAGPEKFALAVELTRATFPFLALISLVSLLGGALNALGRFAAAAAAPVLLNLALIGALLFFHDGEVAAARALAIAVTVSGLIQLVWLMLAAERAGIGLRLRWPRLSPQVRRMLVLMLPVALGAGAQQINLLIDTILASRFLPEGSLSYLYFGDRLNQLPIGVIGVALGTVLLPTLSRQIAEKADAAALHSQNRAVELALLLTLPAAAGLLLIPEGIVRVLFERGAFDALATAKSAAALAAYALGLPAYVLIKVLVPGFYARKDTATPVRIAIASLATNSVLGVVLMFPLAHVGLALATAIAAWLNAGLLYLTLRRRGHFRIDAGLRLRGVKICLAALIMGLALILLSHVMRGMLEPSAPWAIAALIALILAAGIVYVLAVLALRIFTLAEMKARFKRRA
ncbi:MAG: murein biosynthesis integral membrane protein MurJ [Pseudomonadota bacterium]